MHRSWPAVLLAAALTTLGTVVAKSQLGDAEPPPTPDGALHDIENLGPQARPTAVSMPPPPAAPATAPHAQTAPAAPPWVQVRVKRGDTLLSLFKHRGIYTDLNPVLKGGALARRLSRIHPGQTIEMRIAHGRLEELKTRLSDTRTLHVSREDDRFSYSVIDLPVETRQNATTGTITQSLFVDGKQAGLSDRLIMEMANLFGWDVDFALDIRTGDRFTVIYDEIYLGDKKLRDGGIAAAEFVNRGKHYRAYRYTTSDGQTGYFSEDGRSMRKQFLRTPVDIDRISSGFSLGRRHPILNRIRAHKGVDYAAPRGTPIKATGNGRVVFRGRKGGYGNTLILKHGSKYTTLYAHLSRFARGIRTGSRVEQGQVIAYIGSTGLATGPHLHYEFRVNGVHRNPLTVKLPAAAPLPSKERAAFLASIAPIKTELARYEGTEMTLAGAQATR